MKLTSLASRHRQKLASFLDQIDEFTPEEVDVALELVDTTLKDPDALDAYRFIFVEEDDDILAYVCYGPTPMTDGTFDLYWIATSPAARGKGLGKQLVGAVESQLRAEGARLIRVETASIEPYAATHLFYERAGFACTAKIRDFYAVGNDLWIYTKYFR